MSDRVNKAISGAMGAGLPLQDGKSKGTWDGIPKFGTAVEPIECLATMTMPVGRCTLCGWCNPDEKQQRRHAKEHDDGAAVSFCDEIGQRLSRGDSYRYIAVSREVDVSGTTTMTVECLFQMENNKNTAEERISEPDRLEHNAFVTSMKFARHLDGQSAGAMVDMVERHDLDDKVQPMVAHMSSMLHKVQEQLRDEGDIILQQLYKRGPLVVGAPREFNYEVQDKTLFSNYMSTMKRLLRYIFSTHSWEGPDDPPCMLTEDQARAVTVALGVDWDGDDTEAKDKATYGLILSVLGQQLTGTVFTSVAMSCMAVLALKPKDGGWKTALGFGSPISAVIKISLMLVYGRTLAVEQQQQQQQVPGG